MKYTFDLISVNRLWWILAIGLVLWLSALMIQTSWSEWQENPATVTTMNEMNPVSKMSFPTVIICPPPLIVREKFDLSSKFDSKDQIWPNVSHTE